MSSAKSGPSQAGNKRRRPPRDRRRSAARIAAPAALLAGLTVAALLIRAGLDGNEARPVATLPTTTATVPATTEETPTEPTRTTTETTGGAQFYEIESGDTLESIAADYGTTVEVLLELNPDLDPVALTVGQRIRIS